jgi:hypothetical protein
MKSLIRKIAVSAAAFALTMSMSVPAFAVVVDNTDPIQKVSSDTATIYVSKELKVSQPDKFPNVTDFNFRFEPVKAWDNANVNTALSGADIPVSDMPVPDPVATEHHKITLTGGREATVQVGNFATNQTSKPADTQVQKYRSTPLNIKFEKAGYYMYKITETGSSPESIPGMAYDNNSYYAVVYVCNNVDAAGNTIPGVYVHDITSYRNNPETNYAPNLSDIQNTPDNDGKAAQENNYENLAKVGKTPDTPGEDPETGNPTGPNKLEAFRFFNDQTTHDVVVTNNVTGNLGDVTKEFEYTVTLTGLEKNKLYTTNIDAQDKDGKKTTSQSAEIQPIAGSKGSVDTSAKTFTTDAEGNATFMIKLADDEVMVFNALPATSRYTVEEHESDHIASFTSESTEPDTWKMTLGEKANPHSDTALSTNEETVDAISNVPDRQREGSEDNDGTVTIKFRNHRDLMTPTGLPYYGNHIYVLVSLIGAAIVFFIVRRRKDASEGDCL